MQGKSVLAALLGTWGKPVDRVAFWALVASGVLAALALLSGKTHDTLGIPSTLSTRPEIRRRVVLVLAFVAAFLSLGYIAFYLRAGPRIIDATSYYLEGRVLSHGHFAWTVPSPSASFRGRFLLFHAPNKLSVIFPPGFPLLLALGFKVGAPLVVGPLLAGLLVVSTYALARELAKDRSELERQSVALLAAALSIVCVALRYHTADTMAHGASALGVTVALTAALAGARKTAPLRLPRSEVPTRGTRGFWLVSGLAVGWVICTRPISGMAVGSVILVLAARNRRLLAVLVGSIPGVAFLVLASHAQTGSWLASTQATYYATSDGPPGCFRYGFGAGVGCLGEHKEFVEARLSHGYGFVPAALTTLRRLRVHIFDIANLEPLALFVLVPVVGPSRGMRGIERARVAFGVVVAQILAYVPFYFDGDYPGGGARFFADVLPVEHALLALGVAAVLPGVAFFRRALGVIALAVLGFAVHGAFEHDALARRDGGHPFYDVEEGRTAGKGILFFDTDHGFDLAYDPYADPSRDVLAARLRNDDHDRLLVERVEHPVAHVYRAASSETAHANVIGWTAKGGATRDLWRFEAEADWPPLAQSGGWVEAVWASNSCPTGGRVLTLHPQPGLEARAVLEVPVPRTGKWVVLPRILRRGGPGHGKLRLVPLGRAPVPSDAKLVWDWDDTDPTSKPGQPPRDTCAELPALETSRGVDLDVTGAEWELTATGGDVSLDDTTLKSTRADAVR